MYTEQSIDRVIEVDIVTVIQSFCSDLKKQGANYFCKSPWKEEKTASMSVSPSKQIFKDFSTGIGGNAVKFVMEHEKCSWIEAIKIIAKLSNVFLEEEQVTEEVKRERNIKRDLIALAENINKKYVKNFKELDSKHWAKVHIGKLNYDAEILNEFQIGFANSTSEVTKACIEKAKLQNAIEIGVTKTKDNRSYDFFRERIIFPIATLNGDVVAFGGRRQNGDEFKKYAKYLNSKESTIYSKSSVLYGLHIAKKIISKNGFAILTEGYTDVITMHQKGCFETVATCGTALTLRHCKLLKRFCEHVILFRDGDDAGVNASIRDIDILLQQGFRVSILPLPKEEDPDSFAQTQTDMPKYVLENAQDAIEWRFNTLVKSAELGPHEKAAAIDDACKLLFAVKNEVVRNGYIKLSSKIFKEKQTTIKAQIGNLEREHTEKIEKRTGESSFAKLGLPEGANHEQYLKDRFCEIKNQYYFTKGDGFFPGTNFRITPLFHIKGKKENKRLCEVVNIYNKKALMDFDSENLVSFGDFKRQLIKIGVYSFLTGSTTLHFDLLMQKILPEFNTSLELQTMGWNSNGFWAFSNGCLWNNKFQEVNKYGIMHLEGIDTSEEDEYNEKIDYYYSPAYSVMHKKNQDGDDPYENDRKFIYKQSPITLTQWMDEMITVFKEKGRIGILFNYAAIFRDLFLKNYGYFPLLGGFGEKGSGKSAFGKILQNFFFYNLDALELNQTTLVGFTRRISRTTNTVSFLDEYTDILPEPIYQGLKGAFGGLGREKGMATNDKRTVYDKVNTALYIAGQYLPTRDDNSLGHRLISLQFPLKNYTSKEKEAFNRLMEFTAKGISSLVFDVLEHRKYIEVNLPLVYNETTLELKKALENEDYEERIFGNYAVLLITYKLLEHKIQFPFNYQTIFKQCADAIIDNSASVQDSNGLTEFWNILQWLYEHNIVEEGKHFKIERSAEVKYIGSRKQKMVFDNRANSKQILYLRLNSVHQDYIKEVTKREGITSIGETTLRNYFKNRKYFIGLVKGKRFKMGVSSCYAFDYTKMHEDNIISLETEKQQDIPF